MIARSAPAVLERAGSGDARAGATPWRMLVTETSEATLNRNPGCGAGRRPAQAGPFFRRRRRILAAAVRAAHGAGDGETRRHRRSDFCAGLAREIEQLADMRRTGWPAAARPMSKRRPCWRVPVTAISADSFAAPGRLLPHRRRASRARSWPPRRWPTRGPTCSPILTAVAGALLRRRRTPPRRPRRRAGAKPP